MLVMGAHAVDDEHLEIGPGDEMLVLGLERFLLLVVRLALKARGHCPVPVGIAHQRAHDARDGAGQVLELALVQELAQVVAGVVAGKGPIAFDRRQQVERPPRFPSQVGLDRAARLRIRQANRYAFQAGPGVGAQLRGVVVRPQGAAVRRRRRRFGCVHRITSRRKFDS